MKPDEKEEVEATDSPYMALLQKKIAKPVLSFSRRLINDENDASSANRISLKRPESSGTPLLSVSNKKCRCSYQFKLEEIDQSPTKQQEKQKDKIMKAVQKSDDDPDLIGNFSKPFALPVCNGKHSDLKTISPETLAALISGKYSDLIDSQIIIDARYPYEYEGGHIIGAKNIYDRQSILKELLDVKVKESHEKESEKRHILIFHCEFSSERGPNLFRFLRNKDRQYNTSRYPHLFHPEIYLLGGGYKAFYEKFKELCTPQNYIPMLSKDYKDQMRMYRSKSKNSNCDATKWSCGSILRCERKYRS